MRARVIGVFVTALALLLFAPSAQAETGRARKPITVGVVLDGPSERLEQLLLLIREEIGRLTRSEFEVRYEPSKRVVAKWTRASIRRAATALLDDPEVDLLIAHGVIASDVAAKLPRLPKPVIAPFVLNRRLQGLARPSAVAPPRNLSVVVWSLDLERDLKAFRELGTFRRIGFVINEHVSRALANLPAWLKAQGRADTTFVLVPAKKTARGTLGEIPADVDAVYLGPNASMPEAELKKLAAGLVERRLPSFSWVGRAEVEQGVLAGLGSPDDAARLARRVALNVQSFLLGETPSRRTAAIQRHEQLALNMTTARAIGLWPDWSVITEAILIGSKRKGVKRRLSLGRAVRQAMQSNLDLAIAARGVRASAEEIRSARANLLPRLEVSTSATYIDGDRATYPNSERTIQWASKLTQSIYSERAWANLDIQRHLQRTKEEEREQLKLEVALQVAVTYLGLLQAQTVERIQRENLALTRSNLAMARVRRQLGTAGPEEVFRWEAQIASARQSVIAAVASRNQAEIELNRLLNRPLEEPFVTAEVSLDDPVLLSSQREFRAFMANPLRFKVLREFLVREGLAQAPEVRRLDAAIAAKQRQVASNKRSVYLPSFGLQAGTTHRLYQGGDGSDPISLPPGTPAVLPRPNKLDWFVSVGASLPLYEGGARYAAIDKSQHEHAKLMLQRKLARQAIEAQIRSALHRAGASFPAIRLSRDAAAAARGNLQVVRDAYRTGTASILTLLDAQNQSLVADLAAANASYAFLSDLMQVERAVGRFDFFVSPKERRRLAERLKAYSSHRHPEAGSRPRGPSGRTGGAR